MRGETRWRVVDGRLEQPLVRDLRECLARDRKAAQCSVAQLISAGLVSRNNRDILTILLAAPPKWPRNC
jgi:hypothetical protein